MKTLTATEKREYLRLGSKKWAAVTPSEQRLFRLLYDRLPAVDWKKAEQLARRGEARRSELQIPGTKIVLESIIPSDPFVRPPPIRIRKAGRPSNWGAVASAIGAIPPCAAAMGCLCAGHARGNPAQSPCDTNEKSN